ncbi:MAG: amidohydrolase family protein, partial [Sphingomonadales bacterium]
AGDAYSRALTEKLSHPIEGLLVIRGARIFDSIRGRLTGESTVFVLGGMITAVYDGLIDAPPEATVIDGTGKTLMPALWDMHGHVSNNQYLNYLASGITNVRDMANDPAFIIKTKADIAAGRIVGPDVHALGFIDKKSPYAAPTGMLAETLEEVLGFVDYYAQHGFLGIKLYSSIEPQWVPDIVDYAHARGLKVLGHIPSGMTAAQAVRAGFDEITHVNMILLNFMGAEKIDTRTPLRFTVPGKEGGKLDLSSKEVREFIDLLKEYGVAHDPTMSIFMDMFLNKPGEITTVFSGIADHFPASIRRGAISSPGFNAGEEVAFAATAEVTRNLIKLLHENGILLLPGTDNFLPGFTLLRELAFYVEAGIPPIDALRLATIEPAKYMGLEQSLGSVSPGKKAQLVLIGGDPTRNIADLYKAELVIKGRVMFRPAEILREQGFKPFE